MILIIDNNEERRKDIAIWLRVRGYIVSTISYEYMDYYTKRKPRNNFYLLSASFSYCSWNAANAAMIPSNSSSPN